MVIYRIEVSDPYEGNLILWAKTAREAAAIVKRHAGLAIDQRKLTFKNDKTGILWLLRSWTPTHDNS